MWEKISRFYPPWLDVIGILCLGFIWIYTGARYGLMAEQIPTHFGFGGTPDAWSAKSFGSVFMLLILGTIVWLSMFLTNYFLIIILYSGLKITSASYKKICTETFLRYCFLKF